MIAEIEYMAFATDEPLDELGREQKLVLLKRLRKKLLSLALSLQAPSSAIGAEVILPTPVVTPGQRLLEAFLSGHSWWLRYRHEHTGVLGCVKEGVLLMELILKE